MGDCLLLLIIPGALILLNVVFVLLKDRHKHEWETARAPDYILMIFIGLGLMVCFLIACVYGAGFIIAFLRGSR